ncbi:phosphoribosylpyrophosphate synthetase [Salibacter sp.]|uniref:phosphoribosylpyrophosphate synthetase n=1 Tax=Salibacter sp. TaxID=2010995 RepID=UPI0028700CC4|nr:phosphoribosylpyrophosphate synthetase [Salibacter sp.]MDR9399396.1 phosphoribosylpyrophosphate synthetase [Salibacter sp.]MDR9487614.1 phosphoribosylpyrophosphate synthetase [Salibacter sp.]
MPNRSFDTLSEAVDTLTKEGFNDDFKSEDESIRAIYSKKSFRPDELKIVEVCRFEGESNPADSTEVFAIEANDGTKGTLVMSYSAAHSQDVDLITQLKKVQ